MRFGTIDQIKKNVVKELIRMRFAVKRAVGIAELEWFIRVCERIKDITYSMYKSL